MRFLGVTAAAAPVVGEPAKCIAYMCPWAHACSDALPRPATVERRRCLRYRPEGLRPRAGLSDHALDVLAGQRRSGQPLTRVTCSLLDRLRSGGPSRSMALRRPFYPAAASAAASSPA